MSDVVTVEVDDFINATLAACIEDIPLHITEAELSSLRTLFEHYNVSYEPQPFEDILQNQKLLAHTFLSNSPPEFENRGFYVIDLGAVLTLVATWRKHMSFVEPFYNIACNPDVPLVRTLLACGVKMRGRGSDSMNATLLLPPYSDAVDPSKHFLILTTVESVVSAARYTDCRCVLRLEDEEGVENTLCLLHTATTQYGLQIVGVCYHVGSQTNLAAHRHALQRTRRVFDAALELGHTMTFLDIGGGFNAANVTTLGNPLKEVIEEMFSLDKVRVVASLGQYFADPICVLIASIVNKRVIGEYAEVQYDIFDGYHHSRESFTPLVSRSNARSCSTTMFGPMIGYGGALGCISQPRQRCEEMNVGDWVVVTHCGGYRTPPTPNEAAMVIRCVYVTTVPLLEMKP